MCENRHAVAGESMKLYVHAFHRLLPTSCEQSCITLG